MALTLIAQPNQYHPAYNPIVFAAQSTETTIPGFRFVFKIYESGDLDPFATFRVAALPASAGGYIDISKVIQNKIENTLDFDAPLPIELNNTESHLEYDLEISTEYSYYWLFLDYQDWYGYWTTLTSDIEPFYKAGDLIEIKLDVIYGDDRDLLNGLHTVVADPELDGVDWKLQIDIPFSTIGSGPTTPGTTFYSDRRKLGDMIPPIPYPDSPISISYSVAYNGAVPFVEFPDWTEDKILPIYNAEEILGDILTNSPNYLQTNNNKDKYIIKPYSELYWNTMNNPTGDPDWTLTNTMIAENDLGDKWMLVNYNDWDDPDVKMRQFNISPNNNNWISITPNFDNTFGYNSMQNIYTHINNDGTLVKAKWVDIYPTYAPGSDECDEIAIEFEYTPIGAIGPEYYQYTFRPILSGLNERRVYHSIIDGKNAFLWSEVNIIRYWILSFNSDDSFLNGNQPEPSGEYNSFSTRTSNTLPFGTATASNNAIDAWKAFDGNVTTFFQTNDLNEGGYLDYIFNTGAIRWSTVKKYQINKGSSLTYAPRDWTIQGSNDGSTWTILHTVTGDTSLVYDSPDSISNTKYVYIRLAVTNVNSGQNMRINEFKIWTGSTYATMANDDDCPTTTPSRFWSFGSTPGMTSSTSLTTIAVGPVTSPTLKSRRLFFDYDCEINTTQLLFLDRQGSYSSFLFPLRQIESGLNTKLSYKNEIGFVADGEWTYNTYDSETKVYSSSIEKSYTLTTDWLNTGMSDYFEELITSPEVYVKLVSENNEIAGEYITPWIACTITNTDFINPKQKNRRLINRTITIKLNSNNSINI
jgi:hypothetical protein